MKFNLTMEDIHALVSYIAESNLSPEEACQLADDLVVELAIRRGEIDGDSLLDDFDPDESTNLH